jgi:hypothetical protein
MFLVISVAVVCSESHGRCGNATRNARRGGCESDRGWYNDDAPGRLCCILYFHSGDGVSGLEQQYNLRPRRLLESTPARPPALVRRFSTNPSAPPRQHQSNSLRNTNAAYNFMSMLACPRRARLLHEATHCVPHVAPLAAPARCCIHCRYWNTRHLWIASVAGYTSFSVATEHAPLAAGCSAAHVCLQPVTSLK